MSNLGGRNWRKASHLIPLSIPLVWDVLWSAEIKRWKVGLPQEINLGPRLHFQDLQYIQIFGIEALCYCTKWSGLMNIPFFLCFTEEITWVLYACYNYHSFFVCNMEDSIRHILSRIALYEMCLISQSLTHYVKACSFGKGLCVYPRNCYDSILSDFRGRINFVYILARQLSRVISTAFLPHKQFRHFVHNRGLTRQFVLDNFLGKVNSICRMALHTDYTPYQ